MNFLPALVLLYSFLKSHAYASSTVKKVLEYNVLVLHIGSFLTMPEMNFGLVNKINYKIFSENFKLKPLVDEVCLTPELITYNSNDLMFFEEFRYLSDDYYLLASAVHFLYTQSSFTPNGKVIGRYVLNKMRALHNFGELNLDISEFIIIKQKFIFYLLSVKDFKSLLELFEFLELSHNDLNFLYVFVDESSKLVFLNELMINYKGGTELQLKLLQNTFVGELRHNIIAFSILNSVHWEFYLEKLSFDYYLNDLTFNDIFFDSFSSSASSSSAAADQNSLRFERISNSLDNIKTRIASKSNDHDITLENVLKLFYLINEIRFGPEDEELYEKKIQYEHLYIWNYQIFYFSAILAGKSSLAQRIFEGANSNKVKKLLKKLHKFDFVDSKTTHLAFIFKLFDSLTMSQTRKLYSKRKFLQLISKHYEPLVVYKNNCILNIDFKIKEQYKKFNFPELFTYHYRYKMKTIRFKSFMNHLFNCIEDLTSEELLFLFTSIQNCPVVKKFAARNTIKTTFHVLNFIAKSQELQTVVQNIGVRFLTKKSNLAALLNEPLEHMASIIEPNSYRFLLPFLVTKNQLMNFERFTGKTIDKIFLKIVIPKLKKPHDEKQFFEFRAALKYWLNSPNKGRLHKLKVPLFRKLLTKEAAKEDVIFLTNYLPNETGEGIEIANAGTNSDNFYHSLIDYDGYNSSGSDSDS